MISVFPIYSPWHLVSVDTASMYRCSTCSRYRMLYRRHMSNTPKTLNTGALKRCPPLQGARDCTWGILRCCLFPLGSNKRRISPEFSLYTITNNGQIDDILSRDRDFPRNSQHVCIDIVTLWQIIDNHVRKCTSDQQMILLVLWFMTLHNSCTLNWESDTSISQQWSGYVTTISPHQYLDERGRRMRPLVHIHHVWRRYSVVLIACLCLAAISTT